MNEYIVSNEKDFQSYIKNFENIEDGKKWVENHLNLSDNWKVEPSSKKRIKEIEFLSCVEHMKKTFAKGDTLYTQLIKRNPSGTVYFLLRYIKNNEIYSCGYHYSIIMGDKLDEKNSYSIRMPFGNMDMGFNTVYNLCRKVWNDGYYLNHRWL